MRWYLILAAGCVVILFFYLEENWRGAHAWSETQARLHAQGEALNWNDLIPPPIPDAQNLGAIPLFRGPLATGDDEPSIPLALKRALKNISGNYSLPSPGGMPPGKPTDISAIAANLTKHYRDIFKLDTNAPALSPLADLDALCPMLNDLRAAAAGRPLCRFDRDYISQPPYARPVGSITVLFRVAQALNLHAILALHAGQSDIALGDTKTCLKLTFGVSKEPVLISGLVSIGMAAIIDSSALWEGLRLHAWNDAQLAELQGQLKSIDFLSDGPLCLRGEALGHFAMTSDYMKQHRSGLARALCTTFSLTGGEHQNPVPLPTKLFVQLLPSGWFDLSKSVGVGFMIKSARESFDPTARLVYPQKSEKLETDIEALSYVPWNLLARMALSPELSSTFTFAQGQFRTDAARIACMLERYRLAHGIYPESLDNLRVYDSDGAPHDIMNGEPYHYRPNRDGTYLLYSVGWNLTDEGGKVAYQPGSPTQLDRRNGDWVWPNPVEKK